MVKLVINNYKSQEERVRSLEADDEEWNKKSTVTFAIFKVSKFSNFSNRLLEIDFPFKNSIICTAISHIFTSYSFFEHF